MSGTFFGWPSPVRPIMQSDAAPVAVTSDQLSWVITSIEIGNLLSPIPAGYLMDAVGRRTCLMASAPLALAGWALMLFQPPSVWCLYAARVLHGCAMGIAYTVVPVYLGEMAGADIRGSLGLFHQGMNSSGILFVYACGWLTSYYTLAAIMSAVRTAVFLVSECVVPGRITAINRVKSLAAYDNVYILSDRVLHVEYCTLFIPR